MDATHRRVFIFWKERGSYFEEASSTHPTLGEADPGYLRQWPQADGCNGALLFHW